MSEGNDYWVGLDVGSHRVLCIVAEPGDTPGRFKVIGYGMVKSHGIQKGIVVNLEAVVKDIRAVVSEACQTSGLPEITRVWAAIGGSTLTSENCSGTAVVRGNEVTLADIKTAQQHACDNSLRQGKKLIKLACQGYRLGDDGALHVMMPLGLSGDRVEAIYHAAYGSVSNAENMKRCLQRSGLDLESYEPHPWAAALAVTRKADRYNGVAVLDIGAETTSIAVYHENVLLFTDVRPYGAEYFTRDVSCVFNVDLDEAEELKTTVGSCDPDGISEGDIVQAGGASGSGLTYSRKLLARTLKSRADEFAGMYYQLLVQAGLIDKVGVIVLTGGGASLKGFAGVMSKRLNRPVRVSGPLYAQGSLNLMKTPQASVALGLIVAAASQGETDSGSYRTRSLPNVLGQLKTIFIGDY